MYEQYTIFYLQPWRNENSFIYYLKLALQSGTYFMREDGKTRVIDHLLALMFVYKAQIVVLYKMFSAMWLWGTSRWRTKWPLLWNISIYYAKYCSSQPILLMKNNRFRILINVNVGRDNPPNSTMPARETSLRDHRRRLDSQPNVWHKITHCLFIYNSKDPTSSCQP